jgi:HEPN domain
MAKKKGKPKKFTISSDPKHFLEVAKAHLERVRASWESPDWSDLGTYGLYCLEALVRAASLKAGETPIRTHWGKADQAKNLHERHGLPDIEDLLTDLNGLRKAIAYGDMEFDESDYDAEQIAATIEEYFNQVSEFCK